MRGSELLSVSSRPPEPSRFLESADYFVDRDRGSVPFEILGVAHDLTLFGRREIAKPAGVVIAFLPVAESVVKEVRVHFSPCLGSAASVARLVADPRVKPKRVHAKEKTKRALTKVHSNDCDNGRVTEVTGMPLFSRVSGGRYQPFTQEELGL
jgi:hypothetical protein